jgi:solute carrier family 35 protein F1/2
LFALPLSAAQSIAVDYKQYVSIQWSWEIVGLLAGFGVCLFCIYALVPLALERSGATFLNLSLLTSDVFAIIFGIFYFNYVPSYLYIVAAVLIVAGLIIYNFNLEENKPYQEVEDVVTTDGEN